MAAAGAEFVFGVGGAAVEVRAAGGYQPEVADDVQIQLAVGTGLRGVKDTMPLRRPVAARGRRCRECPLEFCVYRVRITAAAPLLRMKSIISAAGRGGFRQSGAARGRKRPLYASRCFGYSLFEQDVGEMRTADLRARVAVFVQGDFFIGDVDAEILQQLDAAVRIWSPWRASSFC